MQRVLSVMLIGLMVAAVNCVADVRVLVLGGNRTQAEFPVLSTFTDVDGENVEYEQTKDRTLPGLENADILWIGQGEICENAYFLDAATEDKIKKFVEGGGIVIPVGQDSDGGRPCEAGWTPVPLAGVERGGVETFTPTEAPEVGELFSKPNDVTNAHFDDTWMTPEDPYIMLASVGGGDIGFALLKHGAGYYIIAGIENENAGDVATNTPMMENLIYYAVNLLQSAAVDYRGKLAVSWGTIKSIH